MCKMGITFEELVRRIAALAKRRYGEDTSKTRRKVLEDANEWMLEKIRKHDLTLRECFLALLVLCCPIRWLKYRVICKLVWFNYFEGVELYEVEEGAPINGKEVANG